MIQEFIDAWELNKPAIRDKFRAEHPSYEDIVSAVVEHMPYMDKDRITEIDHGHYQGTLVFIVAEHGYQPTRYWAVKVGYGSCSGCDTLAAIRECGEEVPTENQINDYMTEAMHVVQSFKEI